jgi:NitT/TauT family transport system substrate-binding protein
LARQRGLAVHFIAPGALWVTPKGTAELVVAKDAAIHVAADFAGKTIAVTSLADLSYFGTRAWLVKNGVDANTVKFVEIPFPAMGAAVAEHRVDGAMIAEPYLTAAKDATRIVAPVDDAVAPRFLVSGWLASDAWIKTHADIATRFAAVMARTSAWANANPKASAAILARYAKISPDVAATMHRDDYATTLDPKLIQPPIDAVTKGATVTAPLVTANDLIWSPGTKL